MEGVGSVASVGPAFSSSRVVELSSVPPETAAVLLRFLAENKVAFFKDADGMFAANIRLYDPNLIDMGASTRAKLREEKRQRDDADATRAAGSASATVFGADYSGYMRLLSLLTSRDSVKPKSRPLAWLMKLVEEIYDQRYAKDTAELRDVESDSASASLGASSPFPSFVVEFFTKRYGLRSLIDQACWDMLYNVHNLRKDNVEVETFARFLEEYYDADDLLFYLYVRSILQKELNIGFRARWAELGRGSAAAAVSTPGGSGVGENVGTGGAPAPLFLTHRDAANVSKIVFGSESDPLYRTFMALIERQYVGTRKARSDSRRIDVVNFLHCALVEYHETRPGEDGALASGSYSGAPGSSNGAAARGNASLPSDTERLLREAEAEYDERVAAGGSGSGSGSSSSAPAAAGSSGEDAAPPSSALAEEVLRRYPAFFDTLGADMQHASEEYLDEALAGAATLPAEVQEQIRAEVRSQMEAKLDSLLAAVIRGARSAGAGAGSDERDALVAHFTRVMSGALDQANGAAAPADADTIPAFCTAVIRASEVQDTVVPLISLLVTFASSRLQEASS